LVLLLLLLAAVVEEEEDYEAEERFEKGNHTSTLGLRKLRACINK
jgi:hypothetical protein